MSAALIVELIRLILEKAPSAVAGIRKLLDNDQPTDADFEAAKAQIAKDTFESRVPLAGKFPPPPA